MSEAHVTRTYLEMTRPDQLRPAKVADERVRIERVIECPPSFYRYLYQEVGRNYLWVDRLGWSDDGIQAHLVRPEVSLWVMSYGGAPAGYFELQRHDDGSVEIAYVGLLDEFVGRGWGKHLLTCAAERAWESGANRVWVHTCTLDHPAAMPNYLKRGFRPFKEETYTVPVPSDRIDSAVQAGNTTSRPRAKH